MGEPYTQNQLGGISLDSDHQDKLHYLLGSQENEMNPVLHMFLQDQVFHMIKVSDT